MRDMQVQSLGGKDPLEKEMTTHSSILAWEYKGAWRATLHGVEKELDTTNETKQQNHHHLKGCQKKVPIAQPFLDSNQTCIHSPYLMPFTVHSLEKEMATHSNIPAWKIPWTEEPGGLLLLWVAKSWRWLSTRVCTHTLRYFPLSSEGCEGAPPPRDSPPKRQRLTLS